jgi:uncharacterized transporter YbjL
MPLVILQACERSSSLIKPSILTFMSFGKALFVGWCAWIGTLVAGSVVLLLLNKPEWRVAVGMSSFLIGLLAFVYVRRVWRRG